jgi:ATP-dependent protease HslVU (ClpYQ) ATPase subunit
MNYSKSEIRTGTGTGGGKKTAKPTDSGEAGEGKCADGSTMKKATWRDIQIQFNQKSKKFALDQSAVDQLKVDLAKQTAAFIVNPPHKMNPVSKEHVGTFTVGIGGRIKNRKSHDWNVPAAYEKIIDKAMKNLIQKAKKDSKGIDNVRNSNIIITIPCGNYTTLAESLRIKQEKHLDELLRKMIKETK